MTQTFISVSSSSPMTFARFTDLPSELQAYVFHFVPIASLVRSVAPTSRNVKRMVDEYVQRRINLALRFSAGTQEPYTVFFEARRPIDTLTSRHALYFSHVEYAPPPVLPGGKENVAQDACTLLAHFSFVVQEHEKDDGGSDAAAAHGTTSQSAMHQGYDGPSFVQGRHGRRRTNTRTGMFPWTSWSEPVTSSLAAMDGRDRQRSADSAAQRARDTSLARRQVHYDVLRDGRRSVKSGEAPPTYRFQLDALDSFETWMMTLTVQRLWYQQINAQPTRFPSYSAQGTSTAPERGTYGALGDDGASTPVVRPSRWEKRIVEGLDRIFRDWFKPSDEEASPNAGPPPDGAVQVLDAPMPSPGSAANDELSFSWTGRIPDERELELDGQGCTLRIQPHINEHAASHPALISMSSHYYLSNAPLSSTRAAEMTDSADHLHTDFTFHCTALQLNAARLLSVMELIDEHIDVTRKTANSTDLSAMGTSVVRQQTRATEADQANPLDSRFVILSGRSSSGVSWSDVLD